MAKILLSAGCSWTDKNFISSDKDIPVEDRSGWQMWPEIIANKIGMKSINAGLSGSSNKDIFDSVVDNLNIHKNIGMVIIMLSSWDRIRYMGEVKFPFYNFLVHNMEPYKNYKKLYEPQEEFCNIFFNMDTETIKKYSKDVIDSNMRYMFLLSQMLNDKGIPFLIFQGVPSFPIALLENTPGIKFKYTDADFIKDISSNQYHNSIKSNKNVIGFPFMKVFNGYNLNHLLDDNDYVSVLDKHPNRLGQEKIANYIMGIINDRNFNL